MRVAVVTPYHNESTEWLRRCYDSVRAQTHGCLHLFVADGMPNPAINEWECDHLVINGPNKDAGNMARGVGALQCVAHDFDAITFLDADNWYKPDHIASMVELVTRTKAHVGAACADGYRLDGTFAQAGAPPDPAVSIDTSCLFFTRPAFSILPLWLRLATAGGSNVGVTGRDWKRCGLICDRIFTYALRTFGVPIAVNDCSTVCFTVRSAIFYEHIGETPPPGSFRDDSLIEALQWWQGLQPEERVRLIVSALPRDRRPKIVKQAR
jgi:glycosyltransferase involved in cell wall biosynthesis